MELVFVVCQLAAAEVCEEHRAVMYAQNSIACMFLAPAELARLARPGWQVARWRCTAPPPMLADEPIQLEPAALTE